jgi:DNA-binding transcriptional ArsR family regulator
VLAQQIGRRLLHELDTEAAYLAAPVQKRGETLVRMILRIVDEHQRERGPRPVAIGSLAPDSPELRDDAPVAGPLARRALTHHLASLNRDEYVTQREELERHPREQARVAPVLHRLVDRWRRLQRTRVEPEDSVECGCRQRIATGKERGVRNRSGLGTAA